MSTHLIQFSPLSPSHIDLRTNQYYEHKLHSIISHSPHLRFSRLSLTLSKFQFSGALQVAYSCPMGCIRVLIWDFSYNFLMSCLTRCCCNNANFPSDLSSPEVALLAESIISTNKHK